MTETIKHVVFDIGQVLVHYDPTIPFQRLIPDDQQRAFFFENVCTSPWNIEQDRGRSWADAEAMKIAEYPEWETHIRAFRAHWHEMVPYAYDDTVNILAAAIEAGYDVTFLTNFSADTFVEAQEMYPFLKSGRGVTVSGRVKLIKPDPAIYDLHTKVFDLDPAATLFIDDNEQNIISARTYGWQALYFANEKALQPELERFGLSL